MSTFLPVASPAPNSELRADYNYHFALTDAEVDAKARTQPHGHVRPNESGLVAKCGGPQACGICRREQDILAYES